MKYTEEQIKEMTDSEIELAVATKYFKGMSCVANNGRQAMVDGLLYNPCDDWNDVMPIAQKFNIDTLLYNGKGSAQYKDGGGYVVTESRSENPKRSICEVFLMMDTNA